MTPRAILFDFDGVLIESEAEGNENLAAILTSLGHPLTRDAAMDRFMGLSGPDFLTALEQFLGGPIPDAFHAARGAEDARVLAEGIGEVAGAVAFVRSLPPALPIAVTSSSSTRWISTHLAHLGLADRFGGHFYSGKQHVARGKPAPDLYLHAADRLGVPIADCAIIEDSPIGARGAVASGATVVGLCAGTHCLAGHAQRLRAEGVMLIARDFAEVARLLSLDDLNRDAGFALRQ